MSKDLFMRRVYTQNGINIVVEIDCEKKTVSLVDRFGEGQYEDKKWVFACRGREYLGGWLEILKAMEYAIKEADKVLAEIEKRDEEKFVEMLVALEGAKLEATHDK